MEMQPLQPQPLSPIMNPDTSSDTFKNIIIILLLLIVVLSLLGINVFIIFGNFFQNVIDFLKPVVSKTADDLEYASGTLINESSDIVADASKTGIDILNGTMHSVGNLLLTASGKSPSNNGSTSTIGTQLNLDKSINQPPKVAPKSPEPNSTTSAIQTTPSASKQNWCLIGDFQGKRGCVSVEDQSKCLSGQVFPSQQLCLNPTMTQK